jgi:hypothetical protein
MTARGTASRSMMGIASPTASHLPVLEHAVRDMPVGGLVIEHGAGLYSTVLLARLGVRVLCAEPHGGWNEWARWVYQGHTAEIVDSFKQAMSRLSEASVVFLDGPAKERGVMLQAALDRKVPVIIVHDTQKREWNEYGFQPHMFTHPDYEVWSQPNDPHTTTRWVLRA